MEPYIPLSVIEALDSPELLGRYRKFVKRFGINSPEVGELHSRIFKMSGLALYAKTKLRGPGGTPFLIGRHHIEWSEALATWARVLALAARDHGKSHLFTVAYGLWQADRVNPGQLGMIFSSTETQAEEQLDKIRLEVIGGGEAGGPNPLLQHLLPFQKDSARNIRFANGSEIRARAFGTRKARGVHPRWIVGDDLGNDEWLWSARVREKAIDYFLSVMEGMVVPGGQLVVVGTPLHKEDLYNHLEASGEWFTMRHPAIDENGNPLWPQRYSRADLESKKRRLGGGIRWSREFLCKPVSDESSMFPGSLFEAPGVKQPYKLGLPASYWDAKGWPRYTGVDLAMSASSGGDYFVIYTLAVDPETNDRWPVSIHMEKNLDLQSQISMVEAEAKLYDSQLVFIEANQYQRVFTDEMVRTSDVPVKAFYTSGTKKKSVTTQHRGMGGTYSANKNDIDHGVFRIRLLFENGKWKLPWDRATRDIMQEFVGQLQSFGWADGKLQGVGAHDDLVMAAWIAEHAAMFGGSYSVTADNDPSSDAGDDEGGPDFFGLDDVAGSLGWPPGKGAGYP